MKQAACKMKSGKGDVSQGYTSDAILNAPDILFDQLAGVFRSFLVHGTVSLNLLACAFLPLLKSSLKNPSEVNSYRAIAGSRLLLLVCYGSGYILCQEGDTLYIDIT